MAKSKALKELEKQFKERWGLSVKEADDPVGEPIVTGVPRDGTYIQDPNYTVNGKSILTEIRGQDERT